MKTTGIGNDFSDLSTANVADACVRLNEPLRVAPQGIRPLMPGIPVAGPVLPVRIYGSVDVMLEAMETARAGDVLVIDNQARVDEGCIGDLTALEAQDSGIAGIIVWGCHEDTRDLTKIGLPVFSYGTYPKGPTRDDPRDSFALESAHFGTFTVGRSDVVFADDDGVIFVPDSRLKEIVETSRAIRETERAQADSVKTGNNLREQFRFKDYLAARADDPSYTFRKHLRLVGGAIEE